jgi:hypothetical protein
VARDGAVVAMRDELEAIHAAYDMRGIAAVEPVLRGQMAAATSRAPPQNVGAPAGQIHWDQHERAVAYVLWRDHLARTGAVKQMLIQSESYEAFLKQTFRAALNFLRDERQQHVARAERRVDNLASRIRRILGGGGFRSIGGPRPRSRLWTVEANTGDEPTRLDADQLERLLWRRTDDQWELRHERDAMAEQLIAPINDAPLRDMLATLLTQAAGTVWERDLIAAVARRCRLSADHSPLDAAAPLPAQEDGRDRVDDETAEPALDGAVGDVLASLGPVAAARLGAWVATDGNVKQAAAAAGCGRATIDAALGRARSLMPAAVSRRLGREPVPDELKAAWRRLLRRAPSQGGQA